MWVFHQIARGSARRVSLALLAVLAIDGVPVTAAMACQQANLPCIEQAARQDCSRGAAALSCGCQGASQPANQASSRAADLVVASAQHGPAACTHQATVLAVSRANYSIARGRLLVPLPILHSSLLI